MYAYYLHIYFFFISANFPIARITDYDAVPTAARSIAGATRYNDLTHRHQITRARVLPKNSEH